MPGRDFRPVGCGTGSLEKIRRGITNSAISTVRYTVQRRWQMANDTKDPKNNDESSSDLHRRDFVAMSVAAGLAAAGSASGAGLPVVETDVEIKTPDGTCDAAFIHPKSGSHPGVLIWPDAFGLRPSMREMAKRIAAEGYSVLVPNPFYRVGK